MAILVTIQNIRDRWPDPFSDTTTYPDSMVQDNIDEALLSMNMYSALPDNLATVLTKLLTAHYLVFDSRSALGDTDSVSPVSSKSLGPASISYQSAEAKSELEASLNGTIYGQKFLMVLTQWRLVNKPWINV